MPDKDFTNGFFVAMFERLGDTDQVQMKEHNVSRDQNIEQDTFSPHRKKVEKQNNSKRTYQCNGNKDSIEVVAKQKKIKLPVKKVTSSENLFKRKVPNKKRNHKKKTQYVKQPIV